MTVRENVAFPLSVRRRPQAEIDKAVGEMLDLVRLNGFAGRRPSELSGGQQQRVALARALVYRPRLLLMDEPLAALDKRLREDIQQEIRNIHRDLGVTVLYVTHDQEEALRMSDRIAVFSHGKIVQVGTGTDLYERPQSAFVAGFIGNSNMLRGQVRAMSDRTVVVGLPDGSTVQCVCGSRIKVGEEVTFMVRPERLRPSTEASAQVLRGSVTDVTYLGEALQYEIATPWRQNIVVRDNSRSSAWIVGQPVSLAFDPNDAFVFPA
jgi:putative spermidine/putrescine transport system ATP-binding protein